MADKNEEITELQIKLKSTEKAYSQQLESKHTEIKILKQLVRKECDERAQLTKQLKSMTDSLPQLQKRIK